MASFFKVHHRSTKSKARTGEIQTDHGVIQTPAFVPVGTKATIKAFSPQFIKDVGIQVSFVNTYHLVTHPGVEVLEKAGGVHEFSKLNIPLMSDSGEFQVFSLAGDPSEKQKTAKIKEAKFRGDSERTHFGEIAAPFAEKEGLVVKIWEDGVIFRSTFDGSTIEFTPEKSMEYQRKIGADILMPFDECIYHPAPYEYAKKSTERTHLWLKRCIDYIRKNHTSPYGDKQYIFGIIQGGTFEELRKMSAQFVTQQDVDGVAIGGVSVGESKEEMRKQVHWVAEYLPQDKPVHLLGVGQIDDILDLVTHGIDTFDCVEPTRVARMGKIYQWDLMDSGFTTGDFSVDGIDIMKGKYKGDITPLDEHCDCYVCQNFTKAYIHHLLKQRELLAYTLASHHNLYLMERLMAKIREKIAQDML